MTPEELATIKSDLKDAHARIAELKLAMADQAARQDVNRRWGSYSLLVCLAFLGYTSLIQLPAAVHDKIAASAGGKAEKAAEDAATEAAKHLAIIKSRAADASDIVRYSDTFVIETADVRVDPGSKADRLRWILHDRSVQIDSLPDGFEKFRLRKP